MPSRGDGDGSPPAPLQAPCVKTRCGAEPGGPRPGPPLTVGLDGGYIHARYPKSWTEGSFEVIAGKVLSEGGDPTCFAFVPNYDTKPKRRLFEVLKSQGLQMNQRVGFLTDGGDTVRQLPRDLVPESEHWLD